MFCIKTSSKLREEDHKKIKHKVYTLKKYLSKTIKMYFNESRCYMVLTDENHINYFVREVFFQLCKMEYDSKAIQNVRCG